MPNQQQQAGSDDGAGPTPSGRLGDVSAVLRMMQPLRGTPGADDVNSRRRLLADLFRLLGRGRFDDGAAPPTPPPAARPDPVDEDSGVFSAPPVPHPRLEVPPAAAPPPASPPTPAAVGLTPRLEQTLHCLLDGDSEKQVAQRLNLSPHTVHVYVKALYRRFGVSSRGELLALHVRR